MHHAAEIIDRSVEFSQIGVDAEITHLLRRWLPVGDEDVLHAVRQQDLDEALAVVVIGDGGAMPGIGGVDQDGDAAGDGLAEFAQAHGGQVEAHRVGRRPVRRRRAGDLHGFGEEIEIALGQAQRGIDGPEPGQAEFRGAVGIELWSGIGLLAGGHVERSLLPSSRNTRKPTAR